MFALALTAVASGHAGLLASGHAGLLASGHAGLLASGHAGLLASGHQRLLAEEPLGPPSGATFLTDLSFSWLSLVLVGAAALYLAGVVTMRRRGNPWPVSRTLLFLIPGLASIAVVTVTGVGAYDDTLLSVHMVQHMVLSMIAPIFLALGAPVTLLLRTAPKRVRRVALVVIHSRAARVVTFPLVAFGLFVVTPFVLYFTGLYAETMRHEWLHELTHAHFILVGCLFFWPLIGIDPLPNRWPYPGRALLMFLSTPFHTVLGLTVMQSKVLIGGDWYPSLHLGWVDPFADQKVAGGILWAGGEVVSITMLAVLVVQWMRQAEREAKRVDRQLDREEAEAAALAAYNASLASGRPEPARGGPEPAQDRPQPTRGRPEPAAPGPEGDGTIPTEGNSQGAASR